jgi:hypothetical protein
MGEKCFGEATGPATQLDHGSGCLKRGLSKETLDRSVHVEGLQILGATEPIVEPLGLLPR